MVIGKAAVAVIGGSDASGFYASQLVTASWPGVLSSALRTAYGDGGSGFRTAMVSAQGIGGQDSTAITQWTATGGLITQSGPWSIGGHLAGPGWGYLYTSTPGASLTFIVAGTSVGIYTLGADGGRAQWSYAIDSAPAVDVSESATTGLSGLKRVVAGLAPGPHTVTIKHTGIAGQFLSVCGVSGENDTGVVLNNFGRKNATAAGYAKPARVSWNGGSDYPADLLIYSVSLEDVLNSTSPDSWASSVHQHLSHVRDSGDAVGATDIVLVLPHIGRADTASFRYQDFAGRAMNLALTFDAALVNFWGMGRNSWNHWNSLGHWANPSTPGASGTDAVHLSDAGHSYVAAALNTLLQS
ncbi:hypothetical protein [Streptomyces sp. 21So2-11]|uniref:hypothetical protein n=1 Tax=Streptomyces sp. 21So2-11 TaxID=3144408 RepID=UPI00321918EA